MKPKLRLALAILVGLIAGSAVNMGLIMISSVVIPLPEGVDATNMESLKAGMALFEPKHFIMPWLAHALGTLVGAVVAASIALKCKKAAALTVGGFFLVGGVINVSMLPAPMWFNALDLLLAYIPMSYLGYCAVTRK